ncbi:MAG: substrate-binding domain-containing protein, partial [Burkholderiales bacterium]|nr:substrate-binding domain-containing protein [Burkholderiales bacterium]
LILTVADAASSATLAALRRLRLPYVLAYNRHPAHPCVSVDGESAVAQLVARLCGEGHERIVMVSGTLAASDRAQQRLRGYERAMAQAGLAPERLELPFVEPAHELVVARLARAPRPSALVCSNDLLALRCLRAAALAGMKVPQELSVIGFDGIALGRDTMPSLASIAQPNEEIGRTALRCLLGHLEAGTRPGPAASLTLPCTLNAFESMGPAARRQPQPPVPRSPA